MPRLTNADKAYITFGVVALISVLASIWIFTGILIGIGFAIGHSFL